jgi:hypothetical protein
MLTRVDVGDCGSRRHYLPLSYIGETQMIEVCPYYHHTLLGLGWMPVEYGFVV